MAGKRRGGGFRRPELGGTLGTLLRTALQQASGVREVLERGAREGRSRLDSFRGDRRRQEALAELGELVLDLVRRGEIDIAELPEARDLIHDLDALDAEAGDDRGHDDDRDHDIAPPPSRSRFDERAAAPGRRAPASPHRTPAPARRDDDGTVGSGNRWSPPRPAAPARVWRPVAEEISAEPVARPGRPLVPTLPKDPHRKGGISFEDDDLAEYMHPDDVPPKAPPDGDS